MYNQSNWIKRSREAMPEGQAGGLEGPGGCHGGIRGPCSGLVRM